MRNPLLTPLSGILFLAFVNPVSYASTYTQLKANVATLTLSFTLYPYKTGQQDPGGGLRSLLLYTTDTLRLEPPARWQDGTAASAEVKTSHQEMLEMLQELDRAGILRRAQRYYSEARQQPTSEPPAQREYKAYLAQGAKADSCEIKAVYTQGEYHSYVVCRLPLSKETDKVLRSLKKYVPHKAVDNLLELSKRR